MNLYDDPLSQDAEDEDVIGSDQEEDSDKDGNDDDAEDSYEDAM